MRLFKKVRASATPRLKGPGGPARVVPASVAEAGISLWLSSAFPAVGRFAALHPAEAGFTGKPLAGLCSAEFLSGRKFLPDSGKGAGSFWGRTCAIPRLTARKDPRKRFSQMPILRQRVSPPAGQTFPALRAPVGQGQQKGGPRAALLRGKNYARTL